MVFVGDAAMAPYEITQAGGSVEHWNEEAGYVWMQRFMEKYKKLIWINPYPKDTWNYTASTGLVRELVKEQMYPLTLSGLEEVCASSRAVEPTACGTGDRRGGTQLAYPVSRPRGNSAAATGNDGHAMIDSTFSRATWLNSLHMSTLTLSLLEKEGFAREQLLEGSGITPPTCSTCGA